MHLITHGRKAINLYMSNMAGANLHVSHVYYSYYITANYCWVCTKINMKGE